MTTKGIIQYEGDDSKSDSSGSFGEQNTTKSNNYDCMVRIYY